jgi:hypothetical protein
VDVVLAHLIDGLKWIGGLALAAVAWMYKTDRQETKRKLEDHAERIASIDASRPRRSELTEAVAGLREEMRVGMSEVKSEIRQDVVALRSDVNARLDILIQLTRDKA